MRCISEQDPTVHQVLFVFISTLKLPSGACFKTLTSACITSYSLNVQKKTFTSPTLEIISAFSNIKSQTRQMEPEMLQFLTIHSDHYQQ